MYRKKGAEIAIAILTDVIKKIGLEKTYDVFREFIDAYKNEKTPVSLAEEYVSNHKEEVIQGYIGIFQSLAKEFSDRKFILIFDQFESTGRASFDFLVNFIKNMPLSVHVIVSFKARSQNHMIRQS